MQYYFLTSGLHVILIVFLWVSCFYDLYLLHLAAFCKQVFLGVGGYGKQEDVLNSKFVDLLWMTAHQICIRMQIMEDPKDPNTISTCLTNDT